MDLPRHRPQFHILPFGEVVVIHCRVAVRLEPKRIGVDGLREGRDEIREGVALLRREAEHAYRACVSSTF